jgi:hypothetical protein
MPELSRFYGTVIKMYFDDHPPPHFHAEYGDHEAVIQIRNLAIVAGALPARATGMVLEWAALHQRDLLSAWQRAVRREPLGKIEPLA